MLWRMGLHDIAVIGTAAAGYYGADTLQDYLQQLAPNRVLLAPDAGATANLSNIPDANNQTINLCQAWGYAVEVLWWGQSDKQQHLDIDELLVAGRWDEAQAIPPDEFFQLHPKATRKKLFPPKFFPVRKRLSRLSYSLKFEGRLHSEISS